MPILGILASQISGHLFAPSGAYDSLATVTLSSTASSITFAGIPSGYKHLQVRANWSSTANCFVTVQFNGDSTTTNYYNHQLFGSGSAVTANAGNNNNMFGYYETAANVMAVGIMDLLDYSNTNKRKVTRTAWGYDANGSGYVGMTSGNWATTAVNSITLTAGGTTFAANSQFALYGVK